MHFYGARTATVIYEIENKKLALKTKLELKKETLALICLYFVSCIGTEKKFH